MNWDTLEGSWRQLTGKVKRHWGKLTSDSILEINGQRDELVGRIQATYGFMRQQAERHVEDAGTAIDREWD